MYQDLSTNTETMGPIEYVEAGMLVDPQIDVEGAFEDDAAECPICLGDHDHEIHEATLAVRRWFASDVARRTGGIQAASDAEFLQAC